jgi:hypothetical protein
MKLTPLKITAFYFYRFAYFDCYLAQTVYDCGRVTFYLLPLQPDPAFAYPDRIVVLWRVKYKYI